MLGEDVVDEVRRMSSKLGLILVPLLALAGASGVCAEERCSGTLCDFYYGSSSSFDDKPKPAEPPKPLMVPSGGFLRLGRSPTPVSGNAAPAAKQPMVGVGGGGVAAMARGETAERCSGTLCDFYYGKSSSFEDEKPAAASPANGAATAPAATEMAEAPAAPAQGFQTHPEPPRCAAKGADPWSCYR